MEYLTAATDLRVGPRGPEQIWSYQSGPLGKSARFDRAQVNCKSLFTREIVAENDRNQLLNDV